ncbi:MAG: carbohydrate ABC transporter permease, partial [Lachnospiraceae bacterium]
MNKKISVSPVKKSKKNWFSGQTAFLIAIMALPVINWLIFWLYININSILLAFQNRTGAWTLSNFKEVWISLVEPVDYGGSVQLALKNTLKYFGVNVFVLLPVGLILSYFIYKRIFGYRWFRVLFYLPSLVSAVALTTVYSEFINPNGPLGELLKKLGADVPPEGYLARNDTATTAIIWYSIWAGCGGHILLLGGAMSRIPPEIMEAAKIDGASGLRTVWSIK